MVDIAFTVDIVVTFFKAKAEDDNFNLRKNSKKYLSGFFVFDCIAALPGLIT